MEKIENKSQILFENKSMTLSLEGNNVMLVSYKGRASNEEYRANLTKQIEVVKKHRINRIVFDLRKMGVLSAENQQHTSEVYMPEIIRAGLKYSALVVPEDIFGVASAQNVTSKIKTANDHTMQYFKSLQEGINWAKTV